MCIWRDFGGRPGVPARRGYSPCGGGLGTGLGSGTIAGPGGSDGSGPGSGTGTGSGTGLGSRIGLWHRLGGFDLGRLHVELCSLDSLHRACGCLLHLFLLCRDQPVQLCHPRTGRFAPFLVVSVHSFSQHTGTFGPLRQELRQFAPQAEQFHSRAGVDAQRLDRKAGAGAQGAHSAAGEARDRRIGQPAREADEEDREHDRDAEQRAAHDHVAADEEHDRERERGRGEREHRRGGRDTEEAWRGHAHLDRYGPGFLRR